MGIDGAPVEQDAADQIISMSIDGAPVEQDAAD